MAKYAIFLNGPIGAGKTTLGRALAEELSGGFIDGDDFSDPNHSWYCSILSTSRAIVQNGAATLQTRSVVVIAYPLDCMNWIYFRRKFVEAGASAFLVSLRATYAAIVDEQRGRLFSAEEHHRIRTRIAEGYSSRPFSDLVVDTDKSDFAATLAELKGHLRCMLTL